jgi:hypothetical protein
LHARFAVGIACRLPRRTLRVHHKRCR